MVNFAPQMLQICCVCPVGGHAVETWHVSELRQLQVSQLPVCMSPAEDR